ncbi:MAG TPA: hypothetical protein VG944_09150 [Fimbriimonas sp.]|nr:hypothetical protein [Fimbriimonas sp.]
MRSVNILVHEADIFDSSYFLHEVATVWEESGVRVQVLYGPYHPADADLVVLHTDLTKAPIEYLAAVRAYPASINGCVADISKRLVSKNLVDIGDGFEGSVIVKTDHNSGGFREASRAGSGTLPSRFASAAHEYSIYASPAEVPSEVWANRDLVVEKFLPEVRDGLYCLRTWVFLGDKETNSLSYCEEPIVKRRNVVRRDAVSEIPDDLRAMREDLAFDYGKFDYAIVDGQTVLYDANRTPTLGNFPKDQYMPRVRLLAEGLDRFFRTDA